MHQEIARELRVGRRYRHVPRRHDDREQQEAANPGDFLGAPRLAPRDEEAGDRQGRQDRTDGALGQHRGRRGGEHPEVRGAPPWGPGAVSLQKEEKGERDEERQRHVEGEDMTGGEEEQGRRQDDERDIAALASRQQDAGAPRHQQHAGGEQDLPEARPRLAAPPQRQGSGGHPVHQRWLVEEDGAVDAGRDEIAALQHPARRVGVAPFVPLPEPPGGHAEQDEQDTAPQEHRGPPERWTSHPAR